MKRLLIWPVGVVLFLHLFTNVSSSNLASAQQQPVGVVTGVQGQAQLTRATAPSPLPLRFKDGVIIRDIVDTREKSLARILFGGRSTVTVRETTRLEVREEILPTGARRDVHELSSGAILVNVARQLMRPGDEVIIRTPNAVAAVRGSTIFCQCILVPVIQCNLALLFGSATVTPDGQQPVTLTPNTGLNITGSGAGAQVTQTTITPAQANQILQESQVGKVVTEEANQSQIAQAQTQTATELVTAVVEAATQTGATTLETTTASETKAEQTQETTGGTTTETTTAEVTPDTSPKGDQQVVVSSPKTLQGNETLKTFDQSGSWTGSYPVVEVTGTTVDRASEGNLIQVNSGVDFSMEGKLLQVTDSTVTDSRVLEVSGSLTNASPETLITIDPTTVETPGDFITVGSGGSLSVDGPLLKLTDSTIDTGGTLLNIDGGSLTSNTNEALINIDPSTVETSSDFIRITSGGSLSIDSDGQLLTDSGGTLTAGGRFLNVSGGSTVNSTSTKSLFEFSSSKVETGNDFSSVRGSGSKIDLSGQFLKSSGSSFKTTNPDVNQVIQTVGVGNEPSEVVFAGDRAYVTNFGSGTVSIINTRTNTVEQTLAVGTNPEAIAREGSNIYVVNSGSDNVSRIDAITNTVTHTIGVGDEPRDVTILPNNDKAYVSNFGSDTVSVIRTSDNTVIKTIAVGDGPGGIGFTPDGKKIGVLNENSNNVSIIDTSTDSVVATVAVGTKPVDGAIQLKGNKAYIANEGSDNVSVINTSTNTVIATIGVGDGPHAVAITPDSKKVYVANELSNNVSVIDTSTDTVVATIPVGTEPGSIDISRDGKRAYVANFDSNTISVINTETDAVIATVNVGTHPGTVALTRGGTIAFVLNEDSNNVSVVDTINLAHFVEVASGATFKSTTELPLLEFNPSTLDLGGSVVRITGSGSKMELAGPLISAEDTKFNVRQILRVLDGGVLTSSTSEPLMQFTGTGPDKSKVDTLFEFAVIDQSDTTDKPPKVELAGPFLKATNTTFTAGANSLDKSRFIRVADGGLLKSTGSDPLITFDGSTLNPSSKFLEIETPDSTGKEPKVEVAGPLLKTFNNSSFSTEFTFIDVRDKGILKGTGNTPLIQSDGSTFNIGSDVQGSGNFFRLDDNTTLSAEGPATVELAGPLVSDTGSEFKIFNRFLVLFGGSTLKSTSEDPLLQFSGSTVETGTDLVQISGTGSKMTLSGSLLSAGSTLNIGTEPSFSGDLVDIRDGGQLVMNSSKPVVEFKGGTHTIGTDDSTSNNTPNRLFRLAGRGDASHLDSNGLGTDQPIKGDGNDPAPFTGASNPIGGLLKATDGATIEVKRGDGDTSGGNAVRLDTVLYETAGHIIELIGSATKETTLTTADSTMSVFKSKVVSRGSAFALDKSFINVTNGPFLIITGGTEWKVDGDLFKLFNGAKIEVVNGPLILVRGNSPSLLEVSGALVEFGGSGNNKIIVNNNIAVTAIKEGIKVNESSGGTVSIGPNPVKENGVLKPLSEATLGSITQNGVLIRATNNGKVDIKAPGGGGGATQTVNFDAGTCCPLTYTEKGVTFKSFQDHLHLGPGGAGFALPNLPPGTLGNHPGCCSTPYRITHEGGAFDLVSFDIKERSGSARFTNDEAGVLVTINSSTPLGTFQFPAAEWSKIEFVNWDQDSGDLAIDDLVFRSNPDPPLYLVRDGETLVGPTLKPLVEFSDQTVTFDSVLVAHGPPSNGAPSVSVTGPLLKAERSDLTVPFSLLGLFEGSTLVTSSSEPLVWLQGGNHSLSTLKGTAIFDIWGTEIAADLETGVKVGTAKVVQHAGPLLEASGGASVNTQKVLRLDTALLEATAPIINLIGAPNAPTSLTSEKSTIDLIRSQVTSTGPVIALDKGLINVTNGPLINLTHGSHMKVTGDLISMYSGSKINVVNGPLINAAGVGSLLDVSGALVSFGGTGGNKIIVNNAITPTATLSGLPVSATFGGAVSIGANPVKNPGLGNISVTGSLISATNGGKVDIKAK